MRAARFTIDGTGEVFTGRHDPGSTWNGFENPYLHREDMPRFLTMLAAGDHGAGYVGSYWTADDDGGYLYVMDDGTDLVSSESFGPDDDGLYSVGFGYCWMLADDEVSS